jgi:hypothetical protein
MYTFSWSEDTKRNLLGEGPRLVVLKLLIIISSEAVNNLIVVPT